MMLAEASEGPHLITTYLYVVNQGSERRFTFTTMALSRVVEHLP